MRARVNATLASFASVVVVSLVSLVGLFGLSMDAVRIRRVATFFVSFAVGALLGDAFIHLVPEAFAARAPDAPAPLRPSLLILSGMLTFFVVEKLLRHRHGPLHDLHHPDHSTPRPVLAAVNVLGDAIHNFIDGVLIGSSYLAGPTLGVSTSLAVLLHEIPQELGDFAVLVHSGMSVRKAIWINLATASAAILGTAVALAIGSVAHDLVTSLLLPIAAGGFVYLAAADLIPELQHDHSMRGLVVQTGAIALGVAVMGLLTVLD